MCRSMVDIQSAAAEIRRGKKRRRRTNHSMKIYMVSLLHRATINIDRCITAAANMDNVPVFARPCTRNDTMGCLKMHDMRSVPYEWLYYWVFKSNQNIYDTSKVLL